MIKIALRALKATLEIFRIVLEPGELLIDRRLLNLIEREAGAHPIEQIVVVFALLLPPFPRQRE